MDTFEVRPGHHASTGISISEDAMTWTTPCTRAEKHLRDLGEHLEFGRFDAADKAMHQLYAELGELRRQVAAERASRLAISHAQLEAAERRSRGDDEPREVRGAAETPAVRGVLPAEPPAPPLR